MKTFEAIFQHGKFYDAKTKSRIFIKEGAKATLVLDDKDVMKSDPYNEKQEIDKTIDVLADIKEKIAARKLSAYKKIASANASVNFIIKAGKKDSNGNYPVSCIFTLVLLQDLYMVQRRATDAYGVVYSSPCIVEKANPELPCFEKIQAYSLNDAYMKTYDWYFAHYGKPTTNIYQHFSLVDGEGQKHFGQLRMFPLKLNF